MAQTISDLEKERAKLLEAIEAQASQISSKRGGGNEARPHTLNDWLNAAEHVMPASQPQRPQKPIQTRPSTNSERSSSHNNQAAASNKAKASVFGVIIMLSLLLTIIGVLYIGYTSVQKELQQLENTHNNTLEDLAILQDELTNLKKTFEEGGDSEAFSALVTRLDRYEQELAGLKHLQATGTQTSRMGATNPEALRQVTQNFERQLENRMQRLISQLQTAGVSLAAGTATPSTESEMAVTEPTVAEPTPPVVPRVEQKLVTLVAPKSTEVSATDDVSWLKAQGPDNYTLQLASMADRAALEKIIRDKKIVDAKIIPQKRDGQLSYVLIVDSYAQRTAANQASVSIKESTGISPWIRRVRDLTSRVD